MRGGYEPQTLFADRAKERKTQTAMTDARSGIAHGAAIAQYTLLEALKNRVLFIALIFTFIGVFAASFVGDVAVIEHKRVEIAVLASSYRFCAVFVMMILVASTIVREFNDKCLELYLSLPISRAMYFAGKLTGFYIAGFALAAVFSAALLLYAPAAAVGAWFASLSCELILMATVTFFCVLTFNQQITSSLTAALFFYLLCRVTDSIVLISKGEILLHTTGSAVIGFVVETLSFVLPSLERFTRSDWLMYSDSAAAFGALPLIVLQTVVYCALVGAAALIDFSRKNI